MEVRELYREDQFTVMYGSLHIKAAALRTRVDWLQCDDWVEGLVQAEITTAGTADSFMCAVHFARARRAQQVTAATIYTLQYQSYNNRETYAEYEHLRFDKQCLKRAALNSSTEQQS